MAGTRSNLRAKHDAAGRRTRIVHPDGRLQTRSYDARGLLTGVDLATSTGTIPVSRRNYDSAGRLIGDSLGNGVNETRTYTDDGQVATIKALNSANQAVLDLAYQYDGAHRKTQVQSPVAGWREAFAYDADGRLTSYARGDGENQTWQLSPVGNWNSTTKNGSSETRSHTPVHEIASLTKAGAPAQPLVWDAKGNLRRDERNQVYAWDDENRLIIARIPTRLAEDGLTPELGQTARYAYDALGRRLAKWSFGVLSRWTLDGAQEIEELTSAEPVSGLGGTPARPFATQGDGSASELSQTPDLGGILASPRWRINFQPHSHRIPSGFVADRGRLKGSRTSGGNYGWSLDRQAQARSYHLIGELATDSHIGLVAQANATTGSPASTASWSIDLPNGSYAIALLAGGPDATPRTNHLRLAGGGATVTLTDPDPVVATAANTYDADQIGYAAVSSLGPNGQLVGDFDLYTAQVQVTNGRLNIRAGPGAVLPAVYWIEIGQTGAGLAAAELSKADLLNRALATAIADPDARPGRKQGTPVGSSRLWAYGRYVDEPLIQLSRTSPSGTDTGTWYHRDHRYSIVALSGLGGAVSERHTYDAFGKRRIVQTNGMVLDQAGTEAIGYTGRRWDAETKLTFFRSRYNSSHGYFISRDMYRQAGDDWSDDYEYPVDGGLYPYFALSGIVSPLSYDGYQDGDSLYLTYFSPNDLDPSGELGFIGSIISVGIGATIAYIGGGTEGLKNYVTSGEILIDAAVGFVAPGAITTGLKMAKFGNAGRALNKLNKLKPSPSGKRPMSKTAYKKNKKDLKNAVENEAKEALTEDLPDIIAWQGVKMAAKEVNPFNNDDPCP